MKKIMTLSMLAMAAVIAWAFVAQDGGNPLKVQRVQRTLTSQPSLHVDYKPTTTPVTALRRVRRAAANGLTADFSIQGGSAQTAVWSENFDQDLTAWTVNNEVESGWGPVTVELAATSGNKAFSVYDENDKTSLHIDGDYRVTKRNKAHVTSQPISVPANAQFHAYVGYMEWEECGLYILVSTDDFATSTELWNSKNSEISSWAWHKVDADLSAYAGQTIRVRLLYSEGTKSNFGVGGYMGDFYVDGLSITGVQTVDHVEAITGEEIQLADLSAGNPTAWEWSFPGATPETSTDQNPTITYTQPGDYDVTLTVKDAEGTDVKTRTAFIHVEGQHPVAKIGYPAEFRDFATRLPMVAPLVPVQWTDRSEGFPTEWTWAFDFLGNTSSDVVIPEMLHEANPLYNHDGLGDWNAVLVVTNDSSTSYDYGRFHVGYGYGYGSEGLITNFQSGDYATNFTDGELIFPGANDMGITAFAEKFSKPSTPVLLLGAYVQVTKAPTEVEIGDLASVTFKLRKSEGGLPGEVIDIDVWDVTELGYALTNNSGLVQLEFTHAIALDDEFFITIEDVPTKTDAYDLAFAMSNMRDNGNTAYMLNRNGEWRPFTGYFQAAPGGQASLAVYPIIAHSVMATIVKDNSGKLVAGEDVLNVSKEAQTVEQPFFSWLGYESTVESDQPWCSVVSTPNDLTLDTLKIQVEQLPAGVEQREAILTISDQVSTYQLHVVQDANTVSAIAGVEPQQRHTAVEVYDLNGRRITTTQLPKGIYIVREGGKTKKQVVR